ncbi:MAG TPA: 4Fe-4S dicluster domain-containing protein [Dehalococcoidia bacterium]|nr:4Fe-4S dicluster domain-containing protein [Dehalococcoidia bacterium]
MNIENIQQLTQFIIDEKPHIVIDREICRSCDHRACVQTCPANCYTWNEETKLMSVVYETCLECGTCYVVCDKGALDWSYPRGGYGVNYRLT